jgi:ABC-type lipoprotein export system ATPase subunit
VKFIILDDPSQSLDTEHKKALVKVLGEVSLGSQLIIATQDAEFEQEIDAGFKPGGGYLSLKYEGWSKEGPTIKILKK